MKKLSDDALLNYEEKRNHKNYAKPGHVVSTARFGGC
jgi:hypothetical protein